MPCRRAPAKKKKKEKLTFTYMDANDVYSCSFRMHACTCMHANYSPQSHAHVCVYLVPRREREREEKRAHTLFTGPRPNSARSTWSQPVYSIQPRACMQPIGHPWHALTSTCIHAWAPPRPCRSDCRSACRSACRPASQSRRRGCVPTPHRIASHRIASQSTVTHV